MSTNVIRVEPMGEQEASQEILSDLRLKEVLGGTLVPSQGFSKAMARCILNMRLGVDPSSPVTL